LLGKPCSSSVKPVDQQFFLLYTLNSTVVFSTLIRKEIVMFKVAGVSVREGQMKVRWANDMTRVKVLIKTGHSEINLVDLPEPMEKGQAVTYLKTTELYANPQFREAIDAADAKYNGVGVVEKAPRVAKAPKAAKVPKAANSDAVKASKSAKIAPSLEAIRARAASAAGDTVAESAAEGEAKNSVEQEAV